MEVSSELKSQIFSKYLVAELLYKIGRFKWADNFSRHELIIETWANGLWVKQAGLISYHDLAEALREEANFKAYNLSVERVRQGFLVSSFQNSHKRYFVQLIKGAGWSCNCMKYKCWNNRMSQELPQLFQALNGKIFCHHIVAAYNFIKH
ncbi:hypothetical protein [Anabaena sp. 4-3]|uniref:hypothetical protein n=1 Tax=Anabaena sp. 4-3 TaxID=1811979 RepID=UPI00083427FD|nr:hypothetical protein [Anabaena sp. 4-3]